LAALTIVRVADRILSRRSCEYKINKFLYDRQQLHAELLSSTSNVRSIGNSYTGEQFDPTTVENFELSFDANKYSFFGPLGSSFMLATGSYALGRVIGGYSEAGSNSCFNWNSWYLPWCL
jgi:hypothetical protein